jgi:hypothetical protein
MAQQTKRKSSASSGSRAKSPASPKKTRTAAKSRSNGSPRSPKARTSKRKPRSSGSSPRTKAPAAGKGAVDAAKDATAKGAKTAGNAAASATKKLKTPAIAAGTGLVGVAAGIALTRNSKKRVLGVPLPNRRGTTKGLADTAKNIGALAERTGKVAEQVRVASEAIGEDKGPRKSKSAIEVVLEALTSRSGSRAG